MPEFRRLPISEIDEPALPVREAMDDAKLQELAANMSLIGLIQPISVKQRTINVAHFIGAERVEDAAAGDETVIRYEIEAGHRRFTAARMLGWDSIPAMIFQPGELKEGAAMLAENLYREDVNDGEVALWLAQLIETQDLDEAGLCAMVGKSPDWVGDRLRLLKGDELVLQALRDKTILFSAARELNKCADVAHRRYLLELAVSNGMPARLIADMVKQHKINSLPAPAPVPDSGTEGDASAVPSYVMACEFCGGSKDPQNLRSIYIHEWELQNIRRLLRRESEGS